MPSSKRTASPDGFSTLGLSDVLLGVVTALGYEEPTPVQRQTIPLMLAGRDLLAQAATGTGKTAAFALPMIHRLTEAPHKKGGPRGMVLVPTRELAMQVCEAIHKYSKGVTLAVAPEHRRQVQVGPDGEHRVEQLAQASGTRHIHERDTTTPAEECTS